MPPGHRPDAALRGGCLTAPGEGGLHVFRVVGDRVPQLLRRVFRPRSAGAAGPLRYGHLVDGDHVLDEAIVTLEEGGAAAEISTHGGNGVRGAVEELLGRSGVRLVAAADLLEPGPGGAVSAEALAALGEAHAVQAVLFLLATLEAGLAAEVRRLATSLRNDPGHGPAAARRVATLLGRAPFGRALVRPPTLLLAGPPNAGKSTLANRMLGWDRCIVTPEPGTTRDLVGERLSLRGYPFRLVDSAGVRETRDPVERLGVGRTLDAGATADVVVLVLDGTSAVPDDSQLETLMGRRGLVVCLNKRDLGGVHDADGLARRTGRTVVTTSALTGTGLDELADAVLYRSPFRGPATRDFPCPFTDRQVRCLERALAALPEDGPSGARALLDLLEDRT